VIAMSGVLTPVAVALLIVGLLTGSLPVIIGAVAASLAAGVFLVAAVRQRRAQFSAPAAEVSAPVDAVPFPPMAPLPPAGQDTASGPESFRES
jgi:hypothetical protein